MMNKIIIKMVLFCFLLTNAAFCHDCNTYKYPNTKEQNRIDKMLDSRLNLTKEQKEYLKAAKSKNRKEIENVIKKMEAKRDEISHVYMLGIPKFQADLRVAPKKAELVILNQQAKALKDAHRKDFESILTESQKAEFEKIKKEHQMKKQEPN